MRTYFEKKIGETITKEFKTGETFYTKVYARVYFFEILKVSDKGVTFELSSRDKVPAGMYCGETSYYGEYTTEIKNNSKNDILMDVIKYCDMKFLKEYKFI